MPRIHQRYFVKYVKVNRNDDPGLTLTYFRTRWNLVALFLYRKKLLESDLMGNNLQQITKMTQIYAYQWKPLKDFRNTRVIDLAAWNVALGVNLFKC